MYVCVCVFVCVRARELTVEMSVQQRALQANVVGRGSSGVVGRDKALGPSSDFITVPQVVLIARMLVPPPFSFS